MFYTMDGKSAHGTEAAADTSVQGCGPATNLEPAVFCCSVSSVFLASKPGSCDQEQKVVKGERVNNNLFVVQLGTTVEYSYPLWVSGTACKCRLLSVYSIPLVSIVVGAAYHKSHLQVRHWLNITREVTHLRQIHELG
jgi:hypothetical protein